MNVRTAEDKVPISDSQGAIATKGKARGAGRACVCVAVALDGSRAMPVGSWEGRALGVHVHMRLCCRPVYSYVRAVSRSALCWALVAGCGQQGENRLD